jgi:hypothetical protein
MTASIFSFPPSGGSPSALNVKGMHGSSFGAITAGCSAMRGRRSLKRSNWLVSIPSRS